MRTTLARHSGCDCLVYVDKMAHPLTLRAEVALIVLGFDRRMNDALDHMDGRVVEAAVLFEIVRDQTNPSNS